jgi:hypothetical protein
MRTLFTFNFSKISVFHLPLAQARPGKEAHHD